MFQNPTIVYLASGGTLDRIEDYVSSLQDLYEGGLGEFYHIKTVAEQKQVFYYPPGANREACINVKTGNVRVEFQQKDPTVECNRVPHEGKFTLWVTGHNQKTIKAEMVLTRSGGARKCTFCKGSTCEWNRCKEQCRYCHIPLKSSPGHLESECSKLYRDPAIIANNKRLSQRIQQYNDYLNETPKELPKTNWTNEETFQKIEDETQKELGTSRGSYASVLSGAFNQGVTRALKNKTDKENKTNESDTAYIQEYTAKVQRMEKFKTRGRARGAYVDNKSLKNVSEDKVLSEAMHNNARNIINNKIEASKDKSKVGEKPQTKPREASKADGIVAETSSEEETPELMQLDDALKGPESTIQNGPMNLVKKSVVGDIEPPDIVSTPAEVNSG